MYLLIEDFKGGLDSRRSALTSKPGTLQKCSNAHITRGGEIEKRKAFADYAALPERTFGLHSTGTLLYVFGSDAAPTMPTGVLYQQLVHPGGAEMTDILDTENFGGGIYAIAEFSDGAVYHYFRGTRVTAWDTITAPVASNTTAAAALAVKINDSGLFTATSSGAVTTITDTAKGVDFTFTVTSVNGGTDTTQTLTRAVTVASGPATPTVSKVVTVTFGGVFEAEDFHRVVLGGKVFRVTGTEALAGTFVQTFKHKAYSAAASILFFSEIDNPRRFGTDDNGSGFINIANDTGQSEALTATAAYQGNLALFTKRSVQIWAMDPDPLQNRQGQILSNIGTSAPRSVTSFGDLDVFFLADSGIRSLRARDASNNATVSDVGTAIDTIISGDFAITSPAERALAVGVIEPVDGRFWMAMGQRIYVFSYFPTASISAWSTYETDFTISRFASIAGRIYARAVDGVYLYGGATGDEYDSSVAEVVLPYMDGGKPAHEKTLIAFDMTTTGTWEVYMGMDTSAPDARDLVGTVTGPSWAQRRLEAAGIGTHVSARLVCESPGPATIGNFAAHFQIAESS